MSYRDVSAFACAAPLGFAFRAEEFVANLPDEPVVTKHRGLLQTRAGETANLLAAQENGARELGVLSLLETYGLGTVVGNLIVEYSLAALASDPREVLPTARAVLETTARAAAQHILETARYQAAVNQLLVTCVVMEHAIPNPAGVSGIPSSESGGR